MNKKPTIAIIVLSILLMLAGCVPEQYRLSLRTDGDYPDNLFPFYKPSVVFEYTGGAVMNARAGVKEEEADVIDYYKGILDEAYFTKSSENILEGFYKEYMFRIETSKPTEEESKAFSKIYTMRIEQLSIDLSVSYALPEGYPDNLVPIYEGARIFEYAQESGAFITRAGTPDAADAVMQYYLEQMGEAVLEEQAAENGNTISGYIDGHIFTINVQSAQGDEARAFKTIINTRLESAAIDFSSPPQQEWSLALSPEGAYDVRAIERIKNGYVLAGVKNNDAWVVKLTAEGAVQWESTFGGSEFEAVNAVVPTDDGGFLAVGITNSKDGDVTGLHDGNIGGKQTYDVWLVKLSAEGEMQWQKTYGGSANEHGMGAIKTEGGYIIMATSASEDGDVAGWHKGYYKSRPLDDIWVFNIDDSGAINWQISLGGAANDIPAQILASGDGGTIICGETWSNDGDVVRGNGSDTSRDIWAVKLSSSGELQWQRPLGGSKDDYFAFLGVSGDGSAYIAGSTRSGDGDVANAKGSSDYWTVKLSSDGELLWQNALGGSEFDYLHGTSLEPDGSLVVSGWSYSSDGDKTVAYGDADIWTAKLDSEGALLWQSTLGGSRFESALAVFSSDHAGYVVAGYTSSVDGDIADRTQNQYGTPTYDFWLAGLDGNGELQWQKAFGGSANEHLDVVLKTPDGGYLLAGSSYSTDNEGVEGISTPYYWILKLKHGYKAAE